MVRRAGAHYKLGRSTARDGALLKLKCFEDAEAQVIGFVELLHNNNEATRSELGRTKRSSARAGKSVSGMLGALVVGVEFEVGTGYTWGSGSSGWFEDDERRAFWRDRVEGANAGVLVSGIFRCSHQVQALRDRRPEQASLPGLPRLPRGRRHELSPVPLRQLFFSDLGARSSATTIIF